MSKPKIVIKSDYFSQGSYDSEDVTFEITKGELFITCAGRFDSHTVKISDYKDVAKLLLWIMSNVHKLVVFKERDK